MNPIQQNSTVVTCPATWPLGVLCSLAIVPFKLLVLKGTTAVAAACPHACSEHLRGDPLGPKGSPRLFLDLHSR